MSPEPRPTSVPSGILILSTVWPQYSNVTGRQTGKRFRSIGRTVTCNGRPKLGMFQTTVYVQVVFMKLGEIDTIKETFSADVFIQARWREPRLDGSQMAKNIVRFDFRKSVKNLI